MMTVIADTAHELVGKAIQEVLKSGENRSVWGGTIAKDIKDKYSPNDFEREMIELVPLTMTLTNPLARWCDWSDHWTGITLRETEDTLQGLNPGYVTKYSKLYPRWLKNGFFNYTYGERLAHYPYNLKEISSNGSPGFEFNQIERAIELLRINPSSRKVCISTWYPPRDLGNDYCPCNALFQLRVVDGKLNWITVIRSLDVLRGLTENIFMFTIWQEYVAKMLAVPLGTYKTVALNAHLYQDMIDSGYHKQNIPDPYDFYEPKPAFQYLFPYLDLLEIDKCLFTQTSYSHKEPFAINMAQSLPEYWRIWKLTLIMEWLRLNKKLPLLRSLLEHIPSNEFKFSTIRRLYKKYPNENYEIFLDWDKQREYLCNLKNK